MRQTAVIKQNGEVVGTMSRSGTMFTSNAMGRLVQESGLSDPHSIESLLKERFGGSIKVETFAEGAGPSYAEVHNSIYSESYESLIDRQTAEYQREMSSNSLGRVLNISA